MIDIITRVAEVAPGVGAAVAAIETEFGGYIWGRLRNRRLTQIEV
jgi:hypothetical protein